MVLLYLFRENRTHPFAGEKSKPEVQVFEAVPRGSWRRQYSCLLSGVLCWTQVPYANQRKAVCSKERCVRLLDQLTLACLHLKTVVRATKTFSAAVEYIQGSFPFETRCVSRKATRKGFGLLPHKSTWPTCNHFWFSNFHVINSINFLSQKIGELESNANVALVKHSLQFRKQQSAHLRNTKMDFHEGRSFICRIHHYYTQLILAASQFKIMRFWGFHNLFGPLICLDCIIMCHFLHLESILAGNRPFIIELCLLAECTGNYLPKLSRQLGYNSHRGPHFSVNYFWPLNYQLSAKKNQKCSPKMIFSFWPVMNSNEEHALLLGRDRI